MNWYNRIKLADRPKTDLTPYYKEVIDFFNKGYNIKQIVKEVSIGEGAVYKILRDNNLSFEKRRQEKREEMDKKISKLYLLPPEGKGMSTIEIGSQLGISATTVIAALKRRGYEDKIRKGGIGIKKKWEDPEYRQRMNEMRRTPEHRQKMKDIWDSPERREKHRDVMRELWNDPEHRQKMKNIYKTPEYQQKMKSKMKKQWEDPEFKQKVVDYMKKQWEDPEFRQKREDEIKKQWESPELRQEMRNRMKERWKDPKYRQEMSDMQKRQWEERGDFWS